MNIMNTPAPLKKRFMALLIDFLVIILYGIVLFAVTMIVYFVFLGGIPIFNELGMNLISLTMIMPVILYSIVAEGCKNHATLGKQKMKIRIVSVNHEPIQLWQIIIRNVIKYLPWQCTHMLIFRGFAFDWELPVLWMILLIIADVLPFIWIATVVLRKDHRGIHDLLAKTVVV